MISTIIGVTIGLLIMAGLTYVLFHKPEWEKNDFDGEDLHLSSFAYPVLMSAVIIYFSYTLSNSPISSIKELFSEIVSTAYGELNMYNVFKECIKQGDEFITYSLRQSNIIGVIYYFAASLLLNHYVLVHRNLILDRTLCFLGDCLLQIFTSFMFSTFSPAGISYLRNESQTIFSIALILPIFALQGAVYRLYFALLLASIFPLFWYQAIMGIAVVELGIPEFIGQTLSIPLTCCAGIIFERLYTGMLLYNFDAKKFDTKPKFAHLMVMFFIAAYLPIVWFCFTVLKIQVPSTGSIFLQTVCCGCR